MSFAFARGFLALGALVGELRRLGGMMLALAAAAEGCRGVRCLDGLRIIIAARAAEVRCALPGALGLRRAVAVLALVRV